MRPRVDNETAFLLHSHPWRETSLVVEVFSREHGRVPMVAKGARRTGSQLRGVLMAFQPLDVSWTGKGEVKTLTQASWRGGHPLLGGIGLLCGYYLNELLLRLLAREDAHPGLYDTYAATLAALSAGAAHAPLLRAFELGLLREIGYAPDLAVEARAGRAVLAEGWYLVQPEHGVHEADADAPGALPGSALLALDAGDFSAPQTLAHAKGLMRRLIQYHLGTQALESRRILKELQEL